LAILLVGIFFFKKKNAFFFIKMVNFYEKLPFLRRKMQFLFLKKKHQLKEGPKKKKIIASDIFLKILFYLYIYI
jgi:hypothetical protein